MQPEVLVATLAMIVSVTALAVSSTLSWAQVRSLKKANDLPVMIELLIKEYVADGFQQRERLVLESLPGSDGDRGLSGLPEPLRSAAFHVAWYYNATGLLIALGSVDERMFVAGINFRVRQIWSAMEAHIEAERLARGMPFLDGFEHLAARAFASDPLELQKKVNFQRVPADARRIAVGEPTAATMPAATVGPASSGLDLEPGSGSTLPG